ncbi:hypothetical protein BDQ12DRAFT_675442 [Crucibulum laeve]|uniref:SWR1-complex protein 4 n=1 Tax=Crucibulum laeve TaxID=68775 RepID=A0A5C3MFL8_9AGAR|nr:hypothetical protein BDQ12DRAFT_675442 [Crucibulum laeve]
MAASAADVRSILAIPDPAPKAGPSKPKKAQTAAAIRKQEGITREVQGLIGGSAAGLAVQYAKPRLKQKPNLGGSGKTHWELRAFKNKGRSDDLELKHWVKSTTDPTAGYPFAKYNIQSTSYTYSQDEYTRFLDDREWTKEETDYLFSIVREYDTRWYIIHDSYDYPGGMPRTLEDLKDRYYSVCRKLVRNRPWAGDEISKNQLIQSFQFDKDRELTRKKYLLSLENRTQEQIVEEEALYIEIKRLEQNERKFKKERDDLLRTLAGVDSGLPDIIEDDGTPLGITGDAKRKKKGGTAMDIDSPATPSVASIATPVVKRPQTARNAAYDAQHCIIRTDPPLTSSATKAAHQPAYLRSFKLPVPKAAIAPKITQALAELGISHSRLVMPTKDNCVQLEALLDATTALVETKRLVDKVQADIDVIKEQIALREGRGMEGTTEPSVALDAMEMDDTNEVEAEPEGEDGRAQSVVSTRSVRSRKQTRRSMSISSVDTTATVSTRAGTKRKR